MKTLIVNIAIILLLAGSFQQPAAAGTPGQKRYHKETSAKFHQIIRPVMDKQLTVESWMQDINYFTNYYPSEARDREVNLEHWMYEPTYFYPLFLLDENERNIRIETWMSDPGYFTHILFEAGLEIRN